MKKLFLTLATAVLTASFSNVPVLAAGGGDVVLRQAMFVFFAHHVFPPNSIGAAYCA